MIRPVSYAEILDDPHASELLAEYASECSLPELGDASPQRSLYELMEKSGGFQAFGVYCGSVLVGFATVLIYVLPHYGKKIATTESIFVIQRHRHLGMELIRFVEEYATENECLAFLYSAPLGSRFDRMLAIRYRRSNNVYIKELA